MTRAALSIVLVLVALSAAGCAPQRAFEAAGLLTDLADPAAVDSPRAEPVAFQIEERRYSGDLYRNEPSPAAGLVLVPGLTPRGKDDPRFVAFARTLARAGFLVLVPDMPRLRALEIDARDAEPIADAVRHLHDRQGAAVGLAAISYAAGPAFLAALEPGVGKQVSFVLALGGYHDAEAVLTAFTTGARRDGPGAPWQAGRPNSFGTWIFVRSNVGRLSDARDRVLLAAMAERKLADPSAAVDDLSADLGPEGRAVERLVGNRDPERVPALIAALPAPIRDAIRDLDLKRRPLDRMAPRVILVHGRDDPIIPFSESLALEKALPADRTELFLIDRLAHVDLDTFGIGDGYRIWRAIYRLLELRDG